MRIGRRLTVGLSGLTLSGGLVLATAR